MAAARSTLTIPPTFDEERYDTKKERERRKYIYGWKKLRIHDIHLRILFGKGRTRRTVYPCLDCKKKFFQRQISGSHQSTTCVQCNIRHPLKKQIIKRIRKQYHVFKGRLAKQQLIVKKSDNKWWYKTINEKTKVFLYHNRPSTNTKIKWHYTIK